MSPLILCEGTLGKSGLKFNYHAGKELIIASTEHITQYSSPVILTFLSSLLHSRNSL